MGKLYLPLPQIVKKNNTKHKQLKIKQKNEENEQLLGGGVRSSCS